MTQFILIFIMLFLSIECMESSARSIVVADSATRIPLPNASIYDRHGKAIGMSNNKGILPKISKERYPITIRYIGFDDKSITAQNQDTVFLSEKVAELREVVVESRRQRLLHILAYVREYSTLTSYTDTVFLFREKMVDYMLPTDKRVSFKGWATPRILTCRSYYRFTDRNGLDSVSDASRHHFSWSDWMGLAPNVPLPHGLRNSEVATDTLHGKYSPTEIWNRVNDEIAIDVDVMSDTTSRKWVPNLAVFFRKNLDFERFNVTYRYNNIVGDSVSALDLAGYSFFISSNGRGHNMFRFNKLNEPFYVSTQADVYVLDKELITVKEAGKWKKRNFDIDEVGIYEPMEAPDLSSSILTLVDRVNSLDKESIRLDYRPDYRLLSNNNGRKNFKIGQRALFLLKQATGISFYKYRKNLNKKWDDFKKEQLRKNRQIELEQRFKSCRRHRNHFPIRVRRLRMYYRFLRCRSIAYGDSQSRCKDF